jgi:nucleotide-binding universal stress UspA family protein
MLPIRTILHPTDFSEQSQCALRLAGALARDHGARLVLLHVAAAPVAFYTEGVFVPAPSDPHDEERRQLEQLEVPGAAPAERRLAEGNPPSEILRVAEETGADLIVMGTHGRTGLARLLMGSVAEQVVRRAPCPVLTVKTPFPAAGPAAAPSEEVAANP